MSNEIYFTSDSHVFHSNIIKYCSRPFDNVMDMNHTIISRWNETVPVNGQVYHLGDLAFCNDDEQLRSLVQSLNGRITLVIGNHDNHKMIMRNKDLFQEVCNLKEIKWEGERIVLCHYALRTWNRSHHGTYHLYGHSHGMLPSYGKSFDVGADCWDFRPVSFSQVKAKMDTLPMMSDHDPECRIRELVRMMKDLSEKDRARVIRESQTAFERDLCPYCEEDHLARIIGTEPYSEDHLMCPTCDSTYCIGQPK